MRNNTYNTIKFFVGIDKRCVLVEYPNETEHNTGLIETLLEEFSNDLQFELPIGLYISQYKLYPTYSSYFDKDDYTTEFENIKPLHVNINSNSTKILITSGGTTVPIDMVRKITNTSKGTFGSNICSSFINKLTVDQKYDIDTEITFLTSINGKLPVSYKNRPKPFNQFSYIENNVKTNVIFYDTFDQYKTIFEKETSEHVYDIIILSAAVSDYGVDNYMNGKVRSTTQDMSINLIKLPKLISTVRQRQPNATIVGFKLLVNSDIDELKTDCEKSLYDNDVDIVIGNDLMDIKQDNHTVLISTKINKDVYYDQKSKNQLIINNKTLSDYVTDKIIKFNELNHLLHNNIEHFDHNWVDCKYSYFKHNDKLASKGIRYCLGHDTNFSYTSNTTDKVCEDETCFKLNSFRSRIIELIDEFKNND